MPAIEYAKKHAGVQYYLPSHTLPPGLEEQGGHRSIAHLVGYLDDTKVVLEFYDPNSRKYCWPLHDGVTLVISRNDFYDKSYPMVLAVDYQQLKKQTDDRLAKAKIAYIPDAVQPYPATCKLCKAPARITGKLVMCSNRSCASRTKLLKTLNIKPCPKGQPILCSHRLYDGTYCQKKAVGIVRGLRSDSQVFYCEVGHKFGIQTASLKVNDIVFLTLGGNDYTDRIWNGTKWELR